VAVSSNGVTWTRSGAACGDDDDVPDAGVVLTPSPDWWTFDTTAVGTPDVQARQRSHGQRLGMSGECALTQHMRMHTHMHIPGGVQRRGG